MHVWTNPLLSPRNKLYREDVVNCLVMIQPTLFAYSFNGPPEVASLIYCASITMYCASITMYCASITMHCASITMYYASTIVYCASIIMYCAMNAYTYRSL